MVLLVIGIIEHWEWCSPKGELMSTSIATIETPWATDFTLSTRGSYKLGGDNVVYTSKSDGSSVCHCSTCERPLGFLSQNSMDSEEAWLLMREIENYSRRKLVYCNKENDWNTMLKTHHSLTNYWETMIYKNSKLTCMKSYCPKHGSSKHQTSLLCM